MKRIWISLLLVCVLCTAMLLPARASGECFIFDLQDVFSETDTLNAEADAIRSSTGIAPYFLITDDQGGLECSDYAAAFSEQYCFYEDSVILMEGETKYYIVAHGSANDMLSEDDLIAMRDAYIAADTYSGGVRDYFSVLTDALSTRAVMPPSEEPSAAGSGSPVPGGEETSQHSSRLVDDGDLLTAAQEEQIALALDQVSAQYAMDFVVVTEKSLGGKDKVAYADDYFDYGGYAPDGVLLLYCPNEGVRYISTTGKAIDYFSGDRFSELTGRIIPFFDRADYAGAFLAYAEVCGEITEDATAFPWGLIIFAVLAGAILSFLIPMKILKGQLKSVASKAAATDYVRSGSMLLTQNQDLFLYHTLTRTAKPKNTSSSGTHTGSSGTSHGGGSF